MKKDLVLFVLPNLGHGGVERMTLGLISKFLEDNIDCALAMRRYEGDLLSHIDARVSVFELAPDNLLQFIPTLTKTIKKIKPTVVITAFPDVGLLTWISIKLSNTKTRLIHGVHEPHGSASINPGFISWLRYIFYKGLAKILYFLANDLVPDSKGLGNELRQDFKIKSIKVHEIYNPIIPEDFFSQYCDENFRLPKHDDIHIVALGRLVHQKGFDILIKSMNEVNATMDWRLSIYGDGPEYKNLNLLIVKLGLCNKITLHGFTDSPFQKLAAADLFVIPSRHEGFGNVLVEAMACGVPVIAFDCPHGAREILVDGKYGKLVPPENATKLAEAISNFIEHAEGWINVGIERARFFTFDASYAKWKILISK